MKKKIISVIIAMGLIATFGACAKSDAVIETKEATGEERKVAETETTTETTTEPATEQADYSVCTDFSAEEVEAFAEQITGYVANKDWISLAEYVFFPMSINDKYYDSKEAFLQNDWSSEFSEEFIRTVGNAETKNMFSNWSGITLANGEIFINEIDGKLMVGAINYFDGTNQADQTTGAIGHWKMDVEKTEENLKNHDNLMEIFGSSIALGGTMSVNSDGTFEMALPVQLLSGTYMQDESSLFLQYVTDYEEEGEMTVLCELFDDELYIVSEYDGEEIYWRKLAE